MYRSVLVFRWREHTLKQIFPRAGVTIRSSRCSLTLPMLCWTWQSGFSKAGPYFKASSHPGPLWTHHVVAGLSQWVGICYHGCLGIPPCKRRPAGESQAWTAGRQRLWRVFSRVLCLLSGSKQVAALSDLTLNFFQGKLIFPTKSTSSCTIHGPLHFRLPHFFNTSA